jgi:hypothetical protein
MTKRDQQYRDYVAEHRGTLAGHTPGPWSMSYISRDEFGERWRNVVARDSGRLVAIVAHTEEPEGEANEYLIAAAPDMLACLLKIVNSPADSARLYDEIESAIPVILKAKGKLR